MRAQLISDSPTTQLLAAFVSVGGLYLLSQAVRAGFLPLPSAVLPEGFGFAAALGALAATVVFVLSLVMPLGRAAFCVSWVAGAVGVLYFFTFVFMGTAFTDEEIASRQPGFEVLAGGIAAAGVASYLLSGLATRLGAHRRVA